MGTFLYSCLVHFVWTLALTQTELLSMCARMIECCDVSCFICQAIFPGKFGYQILFLIRNVILVISFPVCIMEFSLRHTHLKCSSLYTVQVSHAELSLQVHLLVFTELNHPWCNVCLAACSRLKGSKEKLHCVHVADVMLEKMVDREWPLFHRGKKEQSSGDRWPGMIC